LPSPVRIADDYEERRIIQEDIKSILDLERVEEAQEHLQVYPTGS
jgi:DNA helicase-2/ATP-dependent DNA helicase PcrA